MTNTYERTIVFVTHPSVSGDEVDQTLERFFGEITGGNKYKSVYISRGQDMNKAEVARLREMLSRVDEDALSSLSEFVDELQEE